MAEHKENLTGLAQARITLITSELKNLIHDFEIMGEAGLAEITSNIRVLVSELDRDLYKTKHETGN